MAYDNTFLPVGSLPAAAPRVGGLCDSLLFFKREDVEAWPEVNPLTGTITTTVVLKGGKAFYTLSATEEDRAYVEEQKQDVAGPYMETTVTAVLGGATVAHHLSVQAMMAPEYGLIVRDRAGYARLVGSADAGARFVHTYRSGEVTSSRKRSLRFSYQSPLPCPVYAAALTLPAGSTIVTEDGSAWITEDGQTITTG